MSRFPTVPVQEMTINVNTYRVTVMSFPNNVVRGGLTSDECVCVCVFKFDSIYTGTYVLPCLPPSQSILYKYYMVRARYLDETEHVNTIL